MTRFDRQQEIKIGDKIRIVAKQDMLDMLFINSWRKNHSFGKDVTTKVTNKRTSKNFAVQHSGWANNFLEKTGYNGDWLIIKSERDCCFIPKTFVEKVY